MANKVLPLRFPVAGVLRRQGFDILTSQSKPQTPWSVNCRPTDPISQRLRGGSRPGLTVYTGGNQPVWPTAVLMTEGGDPLEAEDGDPILLEDGYPFLTEGGDPIWTEDSQEILLPLGGLQANYSDLLKAMQAFGYENVPEEIEATKGTAPLNCTIGCNYRDRFVLGGTNLIFMSRQGDYTDWEYGRHVDDAQRATILQLSEAGEIGEDITALVPHKDAAMLASTMYGLWVLEGDPVTNGTLRNVSRNVGILSANAWTKKDDTIFFMSRDGLYAVGANGSGLQNISGDKLPVELLDIDLTTTKVMLGYNHPDPGIYIFLQGATYHWYFDVDLGGFWPFKLSQTIDAAFPVDGKLILWDGTTAYWEISGSTDIGTDIESHVLFGPYRLGSPNEFGMLAALHGIVQTDASGEVTWRIIVADTAEGVCENGKTAITQYLAGNTTVAESYVSASGTWTSGRSYMSHPRVRAMWMVIWLQSTDVWAFEGITAELLTFGRWR